MTPASALRWISGRDTGISSKTMFAALSGADIGPKKLNCFEGRDIPKDMDDFGRCYRLILAVPEWRDYLGRVSMVFPAWTPFIREWETLQSLYLSGAKGTYPLFEKLGEESRIIDGWEKTGPCSWEMKP
jgi:hypothetical protein